jgi:hypothetical protein
MEKLMKPAEYAQELGISRQAVYAKIKRGILTAKNVEGKLYIVVDKEVAKDPQQPTQDTKVISKEVPSTNIAASTPKSEGVDYKALLKAKDETISVLKGTVKDLKKSNKQISTTLKGEIDLLKEAFYEMRTLYVHQLEQKKPKEAEEAIEIFSEEESIKPVEDQWIGVKKFFKQHKVKKDKLQAKILKRLKKAYKSGDERIISVEEKLKFNPEKNYKDLLK